MATRSTKRSTGRRSRARGDAGGVPANVPFASGYDAPKEFEGKRYTGRKVGRSHKWHYQAGVWTERKVTPDDWTFHYEVPKRRAGRAPEGSGVPVGTRHHWFVLADQFVEKLDANTCSTSMTGHKIGLAHKRADKTAWSASERARRRALIAALQAMIARLEGDALTEREPATNGARGSKRRTREPASQRRPARSRRAAASATA